MNNELIISTKGTTGSAKIMGVIITAILAGIGIITFPFMMEISQEQEFAARYSNDFMDKIMPWLSFLSPFIFIILAFFMFMSIFRVAKTYLDMYDDHIEGVAINGENIKMKGFDYSGAKQFNLSYNAIDNISIEKNIITIFSKGQKFNIMTNSETAAKIFNTYNQMKYSK